MKLIVGLGNPGSKYRNTRHNAGYRVIGELAERYGLRLKKKLFANAKEAQITIFGKKIVFVQPLTFMNLSGKSVLRYKKRFKLSLSDIIVICDDINLPLGNIRIRQQGSHGGHNGIESVIESLSSIAFPRIRIGIKTQESPSDLAEYVLSDFKEDEILKAQSAIKQAADVCESWIKDGIDKAMNIYNS